MMALHAPDSGSVVDVGVPTKTVDQLDAIRRKLNQISYEHAGTTSAAEAAELHCVVTSLRGDVVRW